EETPEPVEEPIAEAAEPVEEPADEETPEPVEEPAEELVAETVAEPHAADEATEIGEDADLEDLVASLEVAAAVEEISSDAETDLPETHPQVFSELEELSEPSEAEAEVPIEETATEEGEERIVAASPGVEWGSRWRETAQGWVESEDGRSTWRPIVATSDTVAQWDVDTYLGVVAGDVATESSGDPEAVVSEARAVAIQRMLDDAVARGAHAVVGTEVAVHEIGGSLVVTATGTAVTLQARD
ncbi:MAG: heavy metal-binding domain-containing protein, partial [Acidimicrobiia bacterium]